MKNIIFLIILTFIFLSNIGIVRSEEPDPIELLREAYKIADSLGPDEPDEWTVTSRPEGRWYGVVHRISDGKTPKNDILIHVAGGLARHGYLGTAKDTFKRMDDTGKNWGMQEQEREAKLHLARHLSARGNMKAFREIAFNPPENDSHGRFETDVWMAAAEEFMLLSDYEKVLECLQCADLSSSYSRQNVFVNELIERKRPEEAMKLAEAMHDPTTRFRHCANIAVLYAKEGNERGFQDVYESVLAEVNSDKDILLNRSTFPALELLKIGKTEPAKKYVKWLLEKFSENGSEPWRHPVREDLVRIFPKLGMQKEQDELVKRLEEFVEDKPEHTVMRKDSFAVAYASIGRYDEAISRIREIEKNEGKIYTRFGSVGLADNSYNMKIREIIEILLDKKEYEQALRFALLSDGKLMEGVHLAWIWTVQARQEHENKDGLSKLLDRAAEIASEDETEFDKRTNRTDNFRTLLVKVLCENRDLDNAVRIMREIENPYCRYEALFLLCEHCFDLGKRKEALEYAEENVKMLRSEELRKEIHIARIFAVHLIRMNEKAKVSELFHDLDLEKMSGSNFGWTIHVLLEAEQYETAAKLAKNFREPWYKAWALAMIAERIPPKKTDK